MLSAHRRKSLRDLTRRRARTLFTTAALALAVTSVGIFALPPLMDRAMQQEVAANRLADVTVYMAPVSLDAEALRDLARLEGVAAVEPRRSFQTRVLVGRRRARAVLVGVADFARQRVDVVTVAAGTAPQPGQALTEAQNARRDQYEGKPGDTVGVIAADGSVRSLRLSGEGRNLDGGQEVGGEDTIVLYADARTVAVLGGRPGYDSLALRLRDRGDERVAATVEAVRRRLDAIPGFAGFAALPEVRAAGDWPGKQELEDFSTLFSIITLLALLSALVLIANTMTTLVGEQTAEIATMKAIGGRRRQIASGYLRTAVLLGLAGTVAGSVFGVLLANLLVAFFGSEFFAIDPGFGVDGTVLAAGVAIGVLGPPLAAVPAIRRGTRVTVREALQSALAPNVPEGRLDRALRHVPLPRAAQIGVRGAVRRRRRSLTTVVQVGLAVATMLAALGLGTGVGNTIHASWGDHGWDIWLGAEGEPFDARAAELVRSTAGVAAIEPVMTDGVEVAGEPAFVWGVASRTMFRHRVSEGRWYTPAEDRSGAAVAVIERNLARAVGARVGDTLPVTTARGRLPLRVIGMADNQQEEGTVLFVPLTTARTAAGLGPAAADGYWIRTERDDPALIDRTATVVEDGLVAGGYEVGTEITYVKERDERAAYSTISTTITVLGLLVIAIGLVGLVGALTMSVLERTREIGMLRCVGARARDIRTVFTIEGLALVLAGWLVGVPLGYALERFLVWLIRESINAEVAFAFPLSHVVLAFAGTVILALLAMLLPLRRAVRLRPGDALRYA